MIRWGILGCGGIAGRMASVLTSLPGSVLHAVAAREGGRAKAFAAAYGVPAAYEGYEGLTADKEVDAVYVATIHPAHADCVRKCLSADKAVLCEKPLTMTLEEAEGLFGLAKERNVLLMEAMWTRFLPAWREIRRRILAGTIGRVRLMEADFSAAIPFDPDSRIYHLGKGGGALLDIGVYAVHALLQVLGTGYTDIRASGRLSSTGSDSAAAVLLTYPDGALGVATCGCDYAGSGDARIYGEKGNIVVPNFIAATAYTLTRTGCEPESRVFEAREGFTYEAEECMRLLAEGNTVSPTVPPGDTLAAMTILNEAARQLRR